LERNQRLPEQVPAGTEEPWPRPGQSTVKDGIPDLVGTYTDINIEKWPFFTAGRVSNLVHKWRELTSDRIMLHDLAGYKIEFDSEPTQDNPCRELTLNAKEALALQTEIVALLEKGVLRKVQHTEGEFISNVFLREKKSPGNI
jgi:hypothetical protein